MDRREFLKTTGGAAAAATAATAVAADAGAEPAVAAPAIGTGITELGLAMPWPDNGQGFGDSARRLALRIETLTERRYRVAIRVGADAGTADLMHGTPHHHVGEHGAFAYFAGLPGDVGLSPHDLDAWLGTAGGQALWDELAQDLGFKPLLAGHAGTSPPLWSTKPVASRADLANEKIFALGLGADVARALGATPVAVEPKDLAGALQREDICFAEWGGALHSLAIGLHASAKHAVGGGLNGNGTALSLSVRLPLWESLGAGDRAAIAAAAAEEFRIGLAEAHAHETMIRSAMGQAHGVVFSPYPADVADALSRVAAATVAHVAGGDARSRRIDHSYMAFKSAVAGPTRRTPLTS